MVWQAQVSIPYFTGIPEDVVTNTFHFTRISPVGSGDYDLLKSSLADFYERVWPTGSVAKCAPWLRPALTRIKIYNLADLIPRTPVLDEIVPLTVGQATSAQVPLEASICLSVKGAGVPGVPLRNQRGRVFIGGLADPATAAGSASTFPTVGALYTDQIIDAATDLIADSSVTGFTWVVYSRTLAQSFPIVGGWVDNAIDTQRRRGNKATGRTLWP